MEHDGNSQKEKANSDLLPQKSVRLKLKAKVETLNPPESPQSKPSNGMLINKTITIFKISVQIDKRYNDKDFILIHIYNRLWTKQEKEKGGKRKAKEQDKHRRNSCKL